ncbi:acyltransferase family protein [Sphingomonas sp. JC676]|uniref:acyltransferase family protein n=1 Tax=Sphingomonas sp. JC676 TaxID=2768065 RepID=UPI0016577266|nr:acyltransferase family protein [Sphingomonas sp. JC676]MBC9031278.1 acyltransferase family protein [Sphingomonas sp. JC676]
MAQGGFIVRGRIEGLNAWRAMLMLGGLLVHGSVLADDLALFDGIELVSGAFRMGAFFAISGMLAALVMTRRRPIDWFGKQSVRIGVPALFGVLVLCPIISLIMRSGADPAYVAGIALLDWHHLWFLFALLAYQPIVYWLFTRFDRRRFVRLVQRLRAEGQVRVLVAIGAVSLILIGVALTATFELAPQRYWPMLLQLRLILGYTPLYFFGFALGLSRAFRVAMLSGATAPIITLVVAAIGGLLWYQVLEPGADPRIASHWGGTLRWVIEAVCPPAAIVLILRSAMSIRNVRPVVDRLCAASFTIYMLHYPILIAINVAAAPLDWSPYLQYAGAVTVTAILCYALHFGVVERSPLLSLFLNGRLPDPRRASPAASRRRAAPRPSRRAPDRIRS